MGKTKFVLIIFLLMIVLLIPSIYADEENQEGEEQVDEIVEQEVETEIQEHKETVINTFGKIIEANGIKEISSGSVVDQVQEVVVEITKGDYIGEEFSTEYVLSYDLEGKMLVDELSVGDKVEVQITEDQDGNVTATVMEVSRTTHIVLVLVLFLASIVLIGGKRGFRTILGLFYAILIIYFLLIKRLLGGTNAIMMSLITSLVVIFGTFAIIDGINKKSLSASIGTYGGVLLAGIISLFFTHFSKMTGGYEDAIRLSVNLVNVKFNFRDLLFAGIMISSIGACMDIALTVASTLDDIKKKDSEITWKELFKEGMKVGKNIIGTMTNTLILAYTGCSLTLILLFMVCDMSLIEILNKETISEQIMLSVIGSLGVIYTAPITAFVYSILNKDKVIYKRVTDSKVDGKRSLKL